MASLIFGTINSPLVANPGAFLDRFALPSGNFFGLTYFGGDLGYAATQFYSSRQDSTGDYFLDTITTSTAAVVNRFTTIPKISSLAFAAPNLGFGANLLYYLRTDAKDTAVFGTITPGGVVGVCKDVNVANMTTNFDALVFAADDIGVGASLFYYLRKDPSTALSYLGVINPLTLVRFDIMPLATNFDALCFTYLDLGYGLNKLYYLRHDNSNTSTFGVIDVVKKTFTDKYVVGKNCNELFFSATDTGFGANLFYYIRGADFTKKGGGGEGEQI